MRNAISTIITLISLANFLTALINYHYGDVPRATYFMVAAIMLHLFAEKWDRP